MKNSLNQNFNQNNQKTLNWEQIQEDFKIKFGKDVFESWLKKMDLLEINTNFLLISVPTRFIRDWITSRYLDTVIQVIKSHNKNINRIEFKINSLSNDIDKSEQSLDKEESNVTLLIFVAVIVFFFSLDFF